MTPTSLATTSTLGTGDLAEPHIRDVIVGGEPLTVAWADSPQTRSQGLRGVTDLGDLDGMLFDLREERAVAFTMRNTLIPLDIFFFDAEGEWVGALEMTPCEMEPCPSYQIEHPARYALEVPAGSLAVDPAATLSFR